MYVEAEISIARPRARVFEFLARSEHLPDYETDFVWVKGLSRDPRFNLRHSLESHRRAGGMSGRGSSAGWVR
jgi:hypothetical protein